MAISLSRSPGSVLAVFVDFGVKFLWWAHISVAVDCSASESEDAVASDGLIEATSFLFGSKFVKKLLDRKNEDFWSVDPKVLAVLINEIYLVLQIFFLFRFLSYFVIGGPLLGIQGLFYAINE